MKNHKSHICSLLGLGLGLVLVWFLFHGTNWSEVWAAIVHADYRWLILAQALIWLTFILRVQRWSYIVRAVKPTAFRPMFSATQIGFLANFVLPGRGGELVRALALGRLADLPITNAAALVMVDRVMDMIGLIVIMLIAALAYHPVGKIVIPGEAFNLGRSFVLEGRVIQYGTLAMVGLLLLVLVFLAALHLAQDRCMRWVRALVGKLSRRAADRACALLRQFTQGLQIFHSKADLAKSISFSLLTWFCFVMVFWTVLRAFGIHCPWYTAFVLESLLSVAISFPGAPGFVGQFHLPIILTLFLLAPQVSANQARAVAIVAHMVNAVPIGIAGLACLVMDRRGLFAPRRAAGPTLAPVLRPERSRKKESV